MSKFMTSKEKKAKQRHQIKSRWYYIFWGTATVTVFVGQVFVGNGFRRMAESFDRVLDAPIQMDIGLPRPRHRMVVPDMWEDQMLRDQMMHPTDPPQKIY